MKRNDILLGHLLTICLGVAFLTCCAFTSYARTENSETTSPKIQEPKPEKKETVAKNDGNILFDDLGETGGDKKMLFHAFAPSEYWIGAQVSQVPPVLLAQFGADETKTRLVVVEQVVPKGPAEAAGMKRGDILLKFGGTTIGSLPDLIAEVGKAKDVEQKVSILRGGQPMEIAVKPEKRPEEMRPFLGDGMRIPPLPGNEDRFFHGGFAIPPEIMQQFQEQMKSMIDERMTPGRPMIFPDHLMPNSSSETMRAKVQATDDALDRLEVSTKTGADGKKIIRVTHITQKGDTKDEKKWEVEKIEDLPREIQADVRSMLGPEK